MRPMDSDLMQLVQNIPAYIDAMRLGKKILFDHFIYTAKFLAIAPAATPTAAINIQADADFIVMAQSFVNFANPQIGATYATSIIPAINILITDTGSGKQLSDQALPVSEHFGTGQFPFILPQPRFFAAKSTLQIQATSFENAATNNLYLAFIGVKVYVTSAPNQ